jgi:hypothetical protein
VLCTTVGGCKPETVARFRALGWCIAAALLNRLQFPFAFCRALMTQVMAPLWGTTVHSCCREVSRGGDTGR